jgi:hypothetical protein
MLNMIPLLLLLILANMTPNWALLDYRTSIAGAPINIFDAAIVIAVIATLLPSRDRFAADRVHPLVVWICGALIVAGCGSAFLAQANGADDRYVMTATRDFFTIPACIYIGYRLLKSPSAAAVIPVAAVLASLFGAVMVMLFVRTTSETLSEESGRAFDELRVNSYAIGDAGNVAMSMALFGLVSRIRMMPRPVAFLVAGLGIGASFLIPHRGGWLCMLAAVVFAILFLPSESVGRRLRSLMMAFGGMAIVMTFAVLVVSAASGRDFGGYIYSRLISLVPGEHEGVSHHAWDTRIPGTIRELELWVQSPVIGKGFGIQEADLQTHQDLSYRHNTWTSFLAETGIIGLAAALMLTIGPIVIGMRMVRARLDKTSVLIGATSAVMGAGYLVAAFFSLSFNKQRHAIIMGLWCGIAMRARAMQLTQTRVMEEYGADVSADGFLIHDRFHFPDQPAAPHAAFSPSH